jgi:hypothetical protein
VFSVGPVKVPDLPAGALVLGAAGVVGAEVGALVVGAEVGGAVLGLVVDGAVAGWVAGAVLGAIDVGVVLVGCPVTAACDDRLADGVLDGGASDDAVG